MPWYRIALAILALVAAAIPALPAATRSFAVVTVCVSDRNVAPAIARIAAGDTVLWRNVGRRSHTIAADDNAWRAFTLARGASHAVKFGPAGTHPYRVDSSIRGSVVVGGATGRGCGGAAASGRSRAPVGQRTRRYRVLVTGEIDVTRVSFGFSSPDVNGTERLSLTWRATHPDVRIRLFGAGRTIIGGTTGFARGSWNVRHTFSDTRVRFGGPCGETLAVSNYRGRLLVVVESATRSTTRFFAASQLLLDAATELDRRARAAQAAACDTWEKGTPSTTPLDSVRIPTPERVTLRPFVGLAQVDAEIRARGLAFPLDRLVRGSQFSLDSRRVTAEAACAEDERGTPLCTETTNLRVTMRFTPRR